MYLYMYIYILYSNTTSSKLQNQAQLPPQFPLSSMNHQVHVGRSFVEHVADTQSFGPWRPNSVALADFAEHGSGVVLCRLWPDPTKVGGWGRCGEVGGC